MANMETGGTPQDRGDGSQQWVPLPENPSTVGGADEELTAPGGHPHDDEWARFDREFDDFDRDFDDFDTDFGGSSTSIFIGDVDGQTIDITNGVVSIDGRVYEDDKVIVDGQVMDFDDGDIVITGNKNVITTGNGMSMTTTFGADGIQRTVISRGESKTNEGLRDMARDLGSMAREMGATARDMADRARAAAADARAAAADARSRAAGNARAEARGTGDAHVDPDGTITAQGGNIRMRPDGTIDVGMVAGNNVFMGVQGIRVDGEIVVDGDGDVVGGTTYTYSEPGGWRDNRATEEPAVPDAVPSPASTPEAYAGPQVEAHGDTAVSPPQADVPYTRGDRRQADDLRWPAEAYNIAEAAKPAPLGRSRIEGATKPQWADGSPVDAETITEQHAHQVLSDYLGVNSETLELLMEGTGASARAILERWDEQQPPTTLYGVSVPSQTLGSEFTKLVDTLRKILGGES